MADPTVQKVEAAVGPVLAFVKAHWQLAAAVVVGFLVGKVL